MSKQVRSLHKILSLLEDQHGCITRQQAIRRVGESQWDELIDGPLFNRLHPAVYRIRTARPTWMQQAWAATLSASDAVVSHKSAARLWGVKLFDDDTLPIEITVPRNIARRRSGLIVHESQQLHQVSHTCRHESGLHVTTPERTIIDLSWKLSYSELACVFDVMCNLKLTSAAKLDNALSQIQTRGVRRIRQVRRIIASRINESTNVESQLERRMVRRIRSEGITDFSTQLPIQTHDGSFRMDIALPELRICIEVDGPHHLEPSRMVQDRQRDTAISACGWTVMRFSTFDNEDEFIRRLHHLIQLRH